MGLEIFLNVFEISSNIVREEVSDKFVGLNEERIEHLDNQLVFFPFKISSVWIFFVEKSQVKDLKVRLSRDFVFNDFACDITNRSKLFKWFFYLFFFEFNIDSI